MARELVRANRGCQGAAEDSVWRPSEREQPRAEAARRDPGARGGGRAAQEGGRPTRTAHPPGGPEWAGLGVRPGGPSRPAGSQRESAPPRPAASPYHVAPPHVKEVSVHHGAVAAALLGYAEQLRVLHPRRRWAQQLLTPQPCHGAASPPARLLHARTERVEDRDWWRAEAVRLRAPPPGRPGLSLRKELPPLTSVTGIVTWSAQPNSLLVTGCWTYGLWGLMQR